MNLTKEAFDEWKEHPVTQEIFTALRKVRSELLEKVSTGATLGHTADVTHGMTCRAIGHVEGLDQLLAIHFSEEDNSDE
jgi:hypothetical protein